MNYSFQKSKSPYLTDSPVVPSSFAIWGIDGMKVPEVKTDRLLSGQVGDER